MRNITGYGVLLIAFMVLTACNGQPAAMPTLIPLPATENSTPQASSTDQSRIIEKETTALPATGTPTTISPMDALAGTARQTTLIPSGRRLTASPNTTEIFALTLTAGPGFVVPTETFTATVMQTASPTQTLIPLPVATILEATSVSANQDFYIAVSGAPVNFTTLPAPSGQHWIIVIASLANNSDHDQTIASDQLRLVDIEGNRYLPAAPDSTTLPPLVNITIRPGERVRGLARYALPTLLKATALEWCLDSTCTQTIQSLIP